MIELVPFNPVHLRHIELTQAQQHAAALFKRSEYVQLLMQGQPYTALADGHILGCGGVFMHAPHIGRAWALLSKLSGPRLRYLTRCVRTYLTMFDMPPRLETLVRHDYDAGRRWVELLGFTLETPQGMVRYGFEGETYDLYSMVRE